MLRNHQKLASLREMTIPRNLTRAAEPSTKKTVDFDRFHNLFFGFRSRRERDVEFLSKDEYEDQAEDKSSSKCTVSD